MWPADPESSVASTKLRIRDQVVHRGRYHIDIETVVKLRLRQLERVSRLPSYAMALSVGVWGRPVTVLLGQQEREYKRDRWSRLDPDDDELRKEVSTLLRHQGFKYGVLVRPDGRRSCARRGLEGGRHACLLHFGR